MCVAGPSWPHICCHDATIFSWPSVRVCALHERGSVGCKKSKSADGLAEPEEAARKQSNTALFFELPTTGIAKVDLLKKLLHSERPHPRKLAWLLILNLFRSDFCSSARVLGAELAENGLYAVAILWCQQYQLAVASS